MPWPWRAGIALAVAGLTGLAFLFQNTLGGRGQAALGVVCFFGVAALFSANLRLVSWRTVAWGVALQVLLVVIIKVPVRGLSWLGIPDGAQPGKDFFQAVTDVFKQFVGFAAAGARFVFGSLADDKTIFAFSALPTIIFVASFFSVLYYLGVLQFVVKIMARGMMYLMGTSGAETLSVTANVVMGQTEAPLTVKPFLPRMTQSELLTVMVGGMAHISGGLMAVYIGFGADAVAILATSVMAAPCSLYLSKVVLPETGRPVTSGSAEISGERLHRNVIDAASGGASDGMMLAINVAAMLIAFIAFLALIDYLLGRLATGQSLLDTLRTADGGTAALSVAMLAVVFACLLLAGRRWWPGLFARDSVQLTVVKGAAVLGAFAVFAGAVNVLLAVAPPDLKLSTIFSFVFAPAALLMGVEGADVPLVADLLGTKLAANEFVAFLQMTGPYRDRLSPRSFELATYALTGFANFASVGIQLGGIGAMAPTRRSDLARLGMWALFVGFLVTLLNASIAGLLIEN